LYDELLRLDCPRALSARALAPLEPEPPNPLVRPPLLPAEVLAPDEPWYEPLRALLPR
jgi:hypothetical protein